MTGREVDLRALAQDAPVHFMGVGGAGMCALAELLLRHGGKVSGCDVKESRSVGDLRALGADISLSHDAAHVAEASALVVTSAVPADHPELLRAHEQGIPVLKRAQALGAWVNSGRLVAIAGTHGKTTTTAMATEILAAAGLEPTGLVGGRVTSWGGNLRFGADDLYVVEADEYDRSFHTLTPDVAVVTNLESDHLDIYGDLEGVRTGFRTFLAGVREGGVVAACADDQGASALLPAVGRAGTSYGLSAGSRLRAVDVVQAGGTTTCRVVEDGVPRGELTLGVGGLHNLRNALGAAAAARAMGVGWDAIRAGLAAFRGVGRRFERLGEVQGVVVVDDYAHHPTEIRATLDAARASFPGSRLVVVFQPHLYSRTRDFHADFGSAVSTGDVVWITDVFPAREVPIPGVTGALVADAAREAGAADVRYHEDVESLSTLVSDTLREGDVLLTLGAGSVEQVGPDVLRRLREGVHA
ncbi:MAG TPA: UDP-N-acetylmuramate--L-alanine ligase [Longimicrobiales bacterium]|nr:UDP-N-acetylmuramate--L-alanine ligase [Longimicrobiales bacterium]